LLIERLTQGPIEAVLRGVGGETDMRTVLPVLLLAPLLGCTAVNTAYLPQGGRNEIFVTTGDVKEPYTSLGIIQATRKGARVIGVIDVGSTDLQAGINDLVSEARAMGGDAVINLKYEQSQITPGCSILGAILFFLPVPTQVNVRGEVIRFGGAR
jgi:uncharacterized protein YbjQ (UPF0145 family)